ncbi:MAG: hypothetical protein U9Q89_00720 [Thermodesulfobacteriota bacterium]|nr:hypothetical protein [Thermodesulfobacteriota bacterium]
MQVGRSAYRYTATVYGSIRVIRNGFASLSTIGSRKNTQRLAKWVGNVCLNRTLNALLSNTLLVQNLQNPEYMKALLNGHSSLEERFAEIDVELVREELKKINEQQEKIPASMKKV